MFHEVNYCSTQILVRLCYLTERYTLTSSYFSPIYFVPSSLLKLVAIYYKRRWVELCPVLGHISGRAWEESCIAIPSFSEVLCVCVSLKAVILDRSIFNANIKGWRFLYVNVGVNLFEVCIYPELK